MPLSKAVATQFAIFVTVRMRWALLYAGFMSVRHIYSIMARDYELKHEFSSKKWFSVLMDFSKLFF